MFFTYHQNNSGGRMVGPEYIFIETDSAQMADALAEHNTPIYFNGCEDSRDCNCCGDRWDTCWEAGTKTPEMGYGYLNDMSSWGRWPSIYENIKVEIYYKDGRIEKLEFNESDYKALTKKRKKKK